MLKQNQWFSAKVILGKQIGRKLGFPTINLDNPALLNGKKEGVYACLVEIENRIYKGILYYGPRLILNEKETILEIYLFDFEKDIYYQKIKFILKGFIRNVENFPNFDEFKKQLANDCQKAKDLLK